MTHQNGGACGSWDFYIDGSAGFAKHQGDREAGYLHA